MYHSWLDRWDERRAQRRDAVKEETAFALDSQLAFPSAENAASIGCFTDLAEQAVGDATFFNEPEGSDPDFEWQDGWIKFRSSVSTDTDSNNIVWAKVTESRSKDRVLVIFHHWNASSRYGQIAKYFSSCGSTVVQIAMPYHFERCRPASLYADHMLSPSLGRTIQSVRQAVLDGRTLIRVLQQRGYGEVSVLGMSLGSWVAGLVAANDLTVKKAVLFLVAGSLADMVWTGRATRHIRASLEDQINLAQLGRAWSPLNLENYTDRLARTDLDLKIVLAQRDTVVLPELSKRLTAKLKEAGARADVLELNCGHYSLSLPPYIIRAGFSASRLLNR